MLKKLLALSIAFSALGAEQFIVKYRKNIPSSQLGFLPGNLLFQQQVISKEQGLSIVEFPPGLRPMAITEQLRLLRSLPEVEYAQLDHPVTMRNHPDPPPLFPSDEHLETQWNLKNTSKSNMATVNASTPWAKFTTAGQDAHGHDIVVAIIDNGFDLSHEDLAENYFVNPHEIPNNGADDDQNGYIDDSVGINLANPGMPVTMANHGTHVAGIVGARGDNGIGIAGINWRVKILPIQLSAQSRLSTANVVKAYTYIIKMKKRWLNTQGREGANIVASNSSFGVNRVDCANKDYPVWNELYDEMGRLGIISVVATANANHDVDVVGDIPSTCPSDFIIAVTNITKSGHLHYATATGAKSVDLAAPGTHIYSTINDSWYTYMSGTSMAAPHVTGSVAYLYGVASKSFIQDYHTRPGAMAKVIKDVLLRSTTPIAALEQITATGGTLNLHRAAVTMSRDSIRGGDETIPSLQSIDFSLRDSR